MMIRKRIQSNSQRRVAISLLGILILCFCLPNPTITSDIGKSDSTSVFNDPYESKLVASAESSGNNLASVATYSREIQGLDISLMNSFADTSTHNQTIDFSGYHIDGWSLYEVLLATSRIVAVPEVEVVGSNSNQTYLDFAINETSVGDQYYSELAQGFYNMNHDGKLNNISLLYDSSSYIPASQNYAYFDLRSDYQDGSTNMVSSVQLEHVGLTPTWANITESAILDADTVYYAVMNGTKIVEFFDIYPVIRWYYQDAAGSFLTQRYNTEYSLWSSDRPYEAFLNYTYTPWNTTSNSALEFQDPDVIDLKGNSSPLTGSDWLFSSTSNVSEVQFSSNQSVSIEYDLTLRYKKEITSISSWYAGTSGSDIIWNVTSILDFPELSGSQDRNLTIAILGDWTVNHLFNETNPTEYYDHFTQVGANVVCSSLADETWILECTSPNYLQTLSKYDTSNDNAITDKVSVSVIMDINTTIESSISVPATNGDACLRVFYQSAEEYAENVSVTAGVSHHQWDISTDSSSNGLHTIELCWMNGTEVGYRTTDVLVYYQTTLDADEYFINAFTEDTFYIGIDFNQIFPAAGIDTSSADVTYSFSSVVNQSLDDQSNGRWDATVSTASMAPGTHNLYVYAEGYAIENKSLTIEVTLIHDTEALTVAWSNTNNISYVESTEISVAYNRVGGSPISTATVNVTIGGTPFSLTWDAGSDTYKRTFYGDDVDPGFGTHSLTIQAWSDGYKAQSDVSETLEIREESTSMTIQWSASSSITYIESVILYVDYEMSNTTSIPVATIEVTIDSDTWPLHWNDTSKRYWLQFNGSDALPGYGVHSMVIEANKYGYEYQNNTLQTLTITKEPTTLVLSWSNGNSISYVQSTTLNANYTQSSGLPVTDATVNVSIGTGFWPMIWNPANSVYELTINGSDSIPGFGIHSVTVLAGETGFENQSNSSLSLTVSMESTSAIVSWSNTNSITFVEQTTLIVSFRMSNNTPIPGATVNVTIGVNRWDLVWDGGTETYRVLFFGLDSPPGFGTHGLVIRADKYGYVNQVDSTESITLSEEPTTLVISWSDSVTITYIESTTLIASYRMSNTTPITGATITVTIGSDSWPLVWHLGTQTYRHTFSGADDPPGFGIHSLSISANKTGYETQSDGTEILTLNKEPTTIVIAWSNTNSITFVESTILSVNYTMSNGSAVTGATVNVTIGVTRWDLVWDGGTETYQVEFLGSDEPPGFGAHSLTIRVGRYGYVNHVNSTETLTLSVEPTSMYMAWLDSPTITYLESTTLVVNYRMSNTTSISSATVTATISGIPYLLGWHSGSQTYRYTFSGSSNPPGIGIHSLTIDANRTGFVSQSDPSEFLIINEEPTAIVATWTNTNTITFVESTILIINYTMSNGTPVTDAVVNVTIGVTRWDLLWDGGTETYRVEFFGFDEPPGFGTHSLTIRAGKFGYVNQVDSSESLTLIEEPTSLLISWSNTDTITYIESTILIASYRMSNTTPITSATITVTIGGDSWPLVWHPGTQTYRYTFSGTDDPPGFGSHGLTIDASKTGYETQLDGTEILTLNEVPTSIVIAWSNTSTITFVESTILSINYTMNNGSAVTGATVNATMGGTRWDLVWDGGTETYRVEFFGSDEPPGFGTHSITIRADKFGYESHTDISQSLTLESEPTSLVVSWIPDNDITFATYSILAVNYRMSDTSPISGAIVNATFGGTLFPLVWSSGDQDYRLRINGSDVPPGFGIYSMNIQASKKGFDPQTNLTQTVTLREEPTSLVIQWSNGNDLGFYEHTFLFVDYRMANLTTILGATLNVTIDGRLWPMTWNATEGKYQVRFEGSDTFPGVGTHSLTIRAGKPGYIGQVDSSQILTLPVIPTTLSLVWVNSDSISYVEQTTLRAIYQMYNTAPVTGATLNVTIDTTPWVLVWNITTQAYEYTFLGSDNPPGFGIHSASVLAWKEDFQSQSNSLETLTISIESTSLVIAWTNGYNISYHSNTTLSVAYLMSDATPIDSATVNATIGGTLWILTWNPLSEAYETTIFGSDIPPGYGTHSVVIEASRYGFEPQLDSLEELTLRVEDTTLGFQWISSSTISYVNETTLRIFYLMSNTSPVVGAIVNVTIDTELYMTVWNSSAGAYEILFRGMDALPGLGTHSLIVMASKANYQEHIDISQSLSILEELTSISTSWTDGNDISYSESTTLYVYYTMSNGTDIPGASVEVTIGADTWPLTWDGALELYKITFIESGTWPGLGSHGLSIIANKTGYETTTDNAETLTISGELGDIDSYWIGDGTITFVESDTLVVNYTIADGTAITSATVNVTIAGTLWDLVWHAASETYRITFNGTDNPPGMGSHGLIIAADRVGYDGLPDTTKTLNIIDESTTITVVWSNSNSITYFEYTYLFVTYSMSNGSDVLGAVLNVTIGGTRWDLLWNSTQGAYGTQFSGSDNPPGLGTHSLEIQASKFGFAYIQDPSESLTLDKDPTSIQITWSNEDSITYVESTTIMIHYRMSNGTPIQTGSLTATIGSHVLPLVWNVSTEAYHGTYNGDMDPPGIGIFSVHIDASSAIFATQSTSVPFSISEEPTVAIASWTTIVFDWTQSVILGIDYRDSYGTLIDGATQKSITIDGSPYPLLGNNGTYWMEFNNTFDLGHHNVVVNISKFGYEFAVNSTISFDIVKANTDIALEWNSITIDYLGQITLSANYTYSGTSETILVGLVEANITINGITTLSLIEIGNLWTINLDGDYLDLGSHSVVILCEAYGYNYAESSETLTVTEVSTTTSTISWTPSNVTIEYTDSLELVVDYTYSGGDVPATALVNVTIDGHFYNLSYSAGAWRVSIPGSDLDIGFFDADISAWLYGYELRTNVTSGINVTLAANSFYITWEPGNLTPTYIDQVNLSVIYLEDYLPILDATVKLYINGSDYDLVYSAVDEMWHFSISAASIDLGVWNVTVTANKTGYAEGFFTDILTVVQAPTTINILDSGTTIYYDETTTVNVYYQLLNLSSVPSAGISFTLNNIEQTTAWNIDHWSSVLNGTILGIGIHTFTITVSAYGYETQSDTLVITVLQIPTSINSDADFTMYARESVSFKVTYIDDRTSTPIYATEFEYVWSEYYTVSMLPNYTYVVTIGGSDFHVGNYTFQITLGRLGFESSIGSIEIEAESILTQLIYGSVVTQYENETISIYLQFLNSVHSTPIDWADVIVQLEGVDYVATYVYGSGAYSLSFRIPLSVSPGNYTLYLSADAEDCQSSSGLVTLEVLAKSEYLLSITVAEQVQAGSSTNVSVSVTEDGEPVSGINVTVTIVIEFDEGEPQVIVESAISNSGGLLTIVLNIPSDASELEVSASFQGSISEFPVQTSVSFVDVTQASTGTGTPIVADPLTIGVVAGGVSLPILALAFRRRRRGGDRVSAPVSVAAVTPVAPPTSPLSDIQRRLRYEIANSEEGVTRAELSRRLGPSASKIGAMVKDLLNSDSGFYEVREGAKKIIKFRNPD